MSAKARVSVYDTYMRTVDGNTNSWHSIHLLTELGGVWCPDWLSTRKFLGQPSVRERWVSVERVQIPTEGGYVRVLSPAYLTGSRVPTVASLRIFVCVAERTNV